MVYYLIRNAKNRRIENITTTITITIINRSTFGGVVRSRISRVRRRRRRRVRTTTCRGVKAAVFRRFPVHHHHHHHRTTTNDGRRDHGRRLRARTLAKRRGGCGRADLLGVPSAAGRPHAAARPVGRAVPGLRALLVHALHVPQVQRAGPPVRADMFVHAARPHRRAAQRPPADQDGVRHETDHRPTERRVHGHHRRIR